MTDRAAEDRRREELIAEIEVGWKIKHPVSPLWRALIHRFGVNSLGMLGTHDLQAIRAVLA
jgi:hypothetical protein